MIFVCYKLLILDLYTKSGGMFVLQEDGKLYIFLELVTQGSLAALYQKYCFQDSQVSAYTRQILNGLKYLHQRNGLHRWVIECVVWYIFFWIIFLAGHWEPVHCWITRDIKCANILVDANGLVKLADFGLAKEVLLTLSNTCCTISLSLYSIFCWLFLICHFADVNFEPGKI